MSDALTQSVNRAEILSGKKLPVGIASLAVVRKADKGTVTLHLPHGSVATARAADVNPVALAFAQSRGPSEPVSDDDDAPSKPELGLAGLFSPGQYVSCVVLRDDNDGTKPAVFVSLQPALVNDGLLFTNLTKDLSVIWGYVVSKEDHGFVVDLGIPGVHAFLPFKNVNGDQASLLPGMSSFFTVSSLKRSAQSVVLSFDPSKPSPVCSKGGELSLSSLKPGVLVDATVKKVLKNGVLVSFLDFFQGTVDLWHLPMPASAFWNSSVTKGQTLRARVLFVNLSGKLVGLSAAPHVVAFAPVSFDLKYGDVVDPATIVRVDPSVGVALSIGTGDVAGASKKTSPDALNALCTWGAIAFCHISKLSDARVEHVERSFAVGSAVSCRVVGFSPMEALVNVSMQPSVLKAAVLSYSELTGGQLLTGTVANVDDYGVLVTLGQGIRGLVTSQHLTDLQSTSKGARAKVGAVVKVRVLEVHAEKRRCSLTMKRSLVDTALPVVTSYEQAAEGAPTLITHGFVTALRPKQGLVVTFYNNVHGFVSEKDLENAGMGSLESCAHLLGTTVKVRIVSADAERRRVALSMRLATTGLAKLEADAASLPAVGTIVSGVVAGVTNTTVPATSFAVVRLLDATGAVSCHAILPFVHCGDNEADAGAVFCSLKPGKKLKEVLLLEQFPPGKNDGYPVACSLKPLLLHALSLGPQHVAPAIDQAKPGQLVAGTVASIKDFGLFVRFVGGTSALAPKSLLNDTAEAVPSRTVGQSVWGIVQTVDTDKQRLLLNLRPSAVECLLGSKAAPSKKRGLEVTGTQDSPADEPVKKPHRSPEVASHPSVASLTVGATVQCRVEAGSAVATDGGNKASLAVTLLGVAGRYKARLSLAECCDVCPFTGAVSNSEGVSTFQRLLLDGSSGSLPVFRAKVVAVRPGKAKESKSGKRKEGVVELELSIRPSDLTLSEGIVAYWRQPLGVKPSLLQQPPAESVARSPLVSAVACHVSSVGFTPGAWCWGVVESQSTEWITVGFGGGVRGRMFVLDADRGASANVLDQAAALTDVAQGRRYSPGAPILCVVEKRDVANKAVLVTGHCAPAAIAAAAKLLAKGPAAVEVQAALAAAGAIVGKSGHRAHVGRCAFGLVQKPANNASLSSQLSLRLLLSPGVSAVVSATHVTDRSSWSSAPLATYFPGQVVYGVVLPAAPTSQHTRDAAVVHDAEVDDADADAPLKPKVPKLAVSLRMSQISLVKSCGDDTARAVVALSEQENRELASVRVVGSVVSGFVLNTTPKGVFLLLGRGVVARCLLKHLADGFVKDVATAFPVGKLVAGRVTSVDEGRGFIAVTLQGSAVTGVRTLVSGSAATPGDSSVRSADDSDSDSDSAEGLELGVAGVESGDSDTASSDGDAAGEGDEDVVSFREAGTKRRKFDWDDGNEDGDAETVEPTAPSAEAALWSADTRGDGEQATVGRRARSAAKKRLESETDAQEKRLASEDFVPESSLDFERLILATPNSSVVWIRYMAFQLSVAEVEGARAIAERALKSISVRDEQEKLNVWVAYLNLEHTYGDAASLSSLFARALQHNDPKKIHAHMLSMYESHGKTEEALALYKIATRKFPDNIQFWHNWGAFQMKSGDPEGARATLTRALQVLPRPSHVGLILKFALLEYKSGFTERGRTVMEGLLSADPKRVDLWSVYIDQEVGCGDHANARRLFERAIHLKLSPKKMKFFFKKYLAFEATHGTPDRVQHVRDAAKAYVEALAP